MATLFQVHASIDNLKSMVKEMSTLWHSGDSVLLLGECAGYLDWFNAYIEEVNFDDESEYTINDISAIYVLSDDLNNLNDSAKLNLDFSKAKSLTDESWVELTMQMDRIVTLNHKI